VSLNAKKCLPVGHKSDIALCFGFVAFTV